MTGISDSVREYYGSKWAAPRRTAWFEVLGHGVEIYKWDAAVTGEDVAIYATIGASAWAAQAPPGRRAEFFIGLEPEFDDIAPAMSMLGAYQAQGGNVADGDTVTLGSPLWPGAPASTFLVVPQIEALLDPLLLPDRTHVHFCEVIPISPGELKLKQKHDAIWLLGELNDRGLPTWRHERRYL